MINTLRDIQLAFQNLLQEQDTSIVSYIENPPNMSSPDRLKIYYNDYFFRLHDSLKDDFKITCKLMGDSEFSSYIKAYLEMYPSTTYTLRELGFSFPEFLRSCDEDPAIVEMAHFECEIIHALFTSDAEVLTLEALSAIDPEEWENLKLLLHPSVRSLTSHYNTVDLFLALDNDEVLASERLNNSVINVIWRYDQRAYFRTLSPEEVALFKAIQSGLVFPDLCETMLEYFEDDAVVEWVVGVLRGWISDGLLAI